ncbi:unnamed protein product [Diplocarpon coronariae]
MSRHRHGPGKRSADATARTSTASAVRGKRVSPPFPSPQHGDESPLTASGTGTGTALPRHADGTPTPRTSPAASEYDSPHPPARAVGDFSGTRPPPAAPVPRASRGPGPGSGVEKSQKRKASVKSVLGRLFGRRRKSSPPPGRAGPAEPHRSDPSVRQSSTPGGASPPSRAAAGPIDEFNRALRSHSIVAEDLRPYTGPERERHRAAAAPGASPHRTRRATTPSRIWLPDPRRGHGQDWSGGLSPRPASSHARGSTDGAGADAAPTARGAVTSRSVAQRRSRSHGELQDAARRRGVSRRRSDEIRYGRESHDPGLLSPMSSNRPETDEPVPDDGEDPHGEHVLPPEPFTFDLAGMKITQAASLEQRVQQLEGRVWHLERAVSRMRPDGPLQLPAPPERGAARYRSRSGTRPATRQSAASVPRPHRSRDPLARSDVVDPSSQGSQLRSASRGSSRPSRPSTPTHVSPPPDPIASASGVRAEWAPPGSARPLSTPATVRRMPSGPLARPTEEPLTGGHYNALATMIVAEQRARQRLESMVLGLQQQIHTVLAAGAADGPGGADFSGFEHDAGSDDGRVVCDGREEFRTPAAGRPPFEDAIFGEVPGRAADETSAPRTLSLSQITMGRPPQPSRHA